MTGARPAAGSEDEGRAPAGQAGPTGARPAGGEGEGGAPAGRAGPIGARPAAGGEGGRAPAGRAGPIEDPAAIRAAITAGEVRRVLAVRVARLGDTLHVRPAVELLRAALPGAEVTLLASEDALPVAAGAAPRVVGWAKGRGPRAWLSRRAARAALVAGGPIDLWLGLEDKPWGDELARELGVRFAHAESTAGEHVVERKAGVLAPLGLWDGVAPPPPIRWAPPPASLERARARLDGLPRPIIGLQAGSHAGMGWLAPRRRRDPAPGWLVGTGQVIAGALRGSIVVHAGVGGAEARAAARVVRDLRRGGAPWVTLLADLDIDDLGGVLASLDAFVSANTGPAHLAAAVGTPLVLLEGPSTPRARPWRADATTRVLNLGLPCSPCRGTEHGRRCPLPACLDGIPPAMVVAALRELVLR